jgi:hypothetical protein
MIGLGVVLYELFHQPGETSVKKADKLGLIYRKPRGGNTVFLPA